MVGKNRTDLTWRDGVAVGLIAYICVAVFYSAFDFLAARGSLFTVDLLGKAVFKGLRDPAVLEYPIELDTVAIFWYNAVHLVVSLLIGLIAVRVVAQAEREPRQRFLVMLVVTAGFFVTVFGVGALTGSFRTVLPWWSIVVANGFSMATAAVYLIPKTPNLGPGVPEGVT
ncbi:MAG: hypothetical protein HKN13_13720 [Rhodothermales bacterium]|nr:hypothetical protein [Rhodothermales bacterium]